MTADKEAAEAFLQMFSALVGVREFAQEQIKDSFEDDVLPQYKDGYKEIIGQWRAVLDAISKAEPLARELSRT